MDIEGCAEELSPDVSRPQDLQRQAVRAEPWPDLDPEARPQGGRTSLHEGLDVRPVVADDPIRHNSIDPGANIRDFVAGFVANPASDIDRPRRDFPGGRLVDEEMAGIGFQSEK